MKTLLATSDRDLLDAATFVLRYHGCNVLQASDGPEALCRWAEGNPSLALLDADLLRIDGFDVCRQMRTHSTAPAVLFTGPITPDVLRRGLAAGVDGYVPKPLSPEQLGVVLGFWMVVQQRVAAGARPRQLGDTLAVGRLTINLRTGAAAAARAPRLQPWETRALYMLAINAGRPVPAACLADIARCWGADVRDEGALRRRLASVRRRLGLTPTDLAYLPGEGFILA